MADLLALLFVKFPCFFVIYPNGIPGQVGYLIVPIPNITFATDCIIFGKCGLFNSYNALFSCVGTRVELKSWKH